MIIGLLYITIIMKGVNKIQVNEQFSFGEPSQHQIFDNELPLPFSAPLPPSLFTESSMEQVVDSPPNSPIDSSIAAKRKIKKTIYSQKKIWWENNFYQSGPSIQDAFAKVQVYDLMGQILQYFLQKYIASEKQRQIWQQDRENCVLKIQRIVDIIKQREEKYAQNPLAAVISCLKIIANQLCLESVSKKQTFLDDILESNLNQLKLVISGKLAFTLEDDDSELSVFSDQSFNPKLVKQHLDEKLFNGNTIAQLLSEPQITQMRNRFQQIKCKKIRQFLIQDLQRNLSQGNLYSQSFMRKRKEDLEKEDNYLENRTTGNRGEENSHGQNPEHIENPEKMTKKY